MLQQVFCFIPLLQTFTPLCQLSDLGFCSQVMLKQVDVGCTLISRSDWDEGNGGIRKA